MLQQGLSTVRAQCLRITSVALLVLSFTMFGGYELLAQQEALTVRVDGFHATDWSSGQAVLTVLDAEGRPVGGLTASSFTARLNTLEVTVTEVSQGVNSELPVAVVLVLDISGSMEGAAMDQAKLAAHSLLDGLGPQDTVAIFAFSDTVNLVQPFTTDHAAAGAAIDSLRPAGQTALYQATEEGVRAIAAAQGGRRALLILSDGLDNGSTIPRDQALATAQSAGVPIFTIGLGDIDRDYLQQLAQESGGQFAEAPTPEALTVLYQQVSELLRGQYILTLDGSALGLQLADAATLSVTASVDGSAGSDERVVCPQQLCIALSGIEPGEQLTEPRTVTADVVSADPVTSVTFFIDGDEAARVTEPPYELTLDPEQLSGKHTLSAEVATEGSTMRTGQLQVQLGAGSSGGQLTNYGIIGAVALVALLIVGYLVLRRRGGGESPKPKPAAPPDGTKPGPLAKPRARLRLLERDADTPPLPAAAPIAELGRLHITTGPLAGQSFAIGAAPVSVGSGHRCLIRLPREAEDGSSIAPEFVRVWVRGKHLVVHELRQLSVAGPTGGHWEILEDGDAFPIGPYSFRFEIGAGEETPHPAAAQPPEDIRGHRAEVTPAEAEATPDVFTRAAQLPPHQPADILKTPPPQKQPEQPPIDIFKRPAPQQRPDEPPPDIFKSKPEHAPQDEASEEEPPQAAAGP